MDVAEAKKSKGVLETNILNLIRAFEKETNCIVNEVDVMRHIQTTIASGRTGVLGTVEADVEL